MAFVGFPFAVFSYSVLSTGSRPPHPFFSDEQCLRVQVAVGTDEDTVALQGPDYFGLHPAPVVLAGKDAVLDPAGKDAEEIVGFAPQIFQLRKLG